MENKLEISMAEVKKDISYIKDALVENKEQHADITKLITDFINSAESKYAPMWSAQAMKAVIFLIVAGIIGGIFKLLFG